MADRQQQSAYLQAMGIQVWALRDAPQVISAEVQNAAPVAEALPVVGEAVAGEVSVDTAGATQTHADKPPVGKPAFNVPPVMDEEPPLPTDDNMPELDVSGMDLPAAPTIDVSTLAWPALQTAVADCTACELHKSRSQTVFGAGDHAAQWMIIGEAPGADEDQQGQPFVGPSGQLLNNMLRALGLKREQVFIANILKCRPADDRDPRAEEVAHCEAFLQRQIALVKPKLILAVGGVAAHNLLKVDTAVGKLRGQLHHYADTPLVVTYHPAYLLHKPSEKAKSWADLQFAASVVAGEQGADA